MNAFYNMRINCKFDFKNRKLQSLEIKLIKQFYKDWTQILPLIEGLTIYDSGIILMNNIWAKKIRSVNYVDINSLT